MSRRPLPSGGGLFAFGWALRRIARNGKDVDDPKDAEDGHDDHHPERQAEDDLESQPGVRSDLATVRIVHALVALPAPGLLLCPVVRSLADRGTVRHGGKRTSVGARADL